MAEQNGTKQGTYHLYAQVSKPYFSYKKPGDGNAYSMMIPQINNGNLTLKFTKSITTENRLDITCYLPYSRTMDIANILEGIMARRRDAFAKNQQYSTSEAYKIPISSFVSGKEELVGSLTIDTIMIDGTPRLRISYHQNDKNDSVEIVFCERPSSGEISASSTLEKIDYYDIGAYGFTTLIRAIQEPIPMIFYHMLDSLSNSLTKYISTVVGGRRNSNAIAPSTDYVRSESFEEF